MDLNPFMAKLGTESAFTVLNRAASLTKQGRDIINLGIGQPDFPTPAPIVEAAVKALRDGHHGYTPAKGLLKLRETVAADFEARNGVALNPDQVMIMPGGKPTMAFAALMLGGQGMKSFILIQAFLFMGRWPPFSGASATAYPLRAEDDYALNAEDVLSKIGPQTRLLILNSQAIQQAALPPLTNWKSLPKGWRRGRKSASYPMKYTAVFILMG